MEMVGHIFIYILEYTKGNGWQNILCGSFRSSLMEAKYI